MARRSNRSTIVLAAMILPLALGVSAMAPAFAHDDEAHTAAAQSAQPAPSDQDMPGMEMPSTEMAWPTEDSMGMAHAERPKTFFGRLMRWLGAWHPAIVHFPVALLLTVAFLELAAAVRRKPIYNASNKILLAVATLSAFVAAPLGWINAGLPAPDDEFALTVHRWIGTAIPFLFLALWALKKPAEEAASRKTPPFFEALLAAAVLAIIAQAYFGAEVTHGAEHLAF